MYNHGSMRRERQKQILGEMIVRHPSGIGDFWSLLAAVAVFALNVFAFPSVFSPFN